LVRELQILKEALTFAKAGNTEGVVEKFAELCAHQQYVMEQEAYYATNEVIRNAQRHARSKVQVRPQSDIPSADDKGEI
jgi:hypothetical protein